MQTNFKLVLCGKSFRKKCWWIGFRKACVGAKIFVVMLLRKSEKKLIQKFIYTVCYVNMPD